MEMPFRWEWTSQSHFIMSAVTLFCCNQNTHKCKNCTVNTHKQVGSLQTCRWREITVTLSCLRLIDRGLILEKGICWEGENAHLIKSTPIPWQWYFPLGECRKVNHTAKGRTRELLQAHLSGAQVWGQHIGLGGRRKLGERRPLKNSRLAEKGWWGSPSPVTELQPPQLCWLEDKTWSDLSLCQSGRRRYEKPMVKTASTKASLTGLRRMTELRALQRHARRRNSPNSVDLLITAFLTLFFSLPITSLL